MFEIAFLQQFAVYAGGAIACLVLVVYAVLTAKGIVETSSTASWLMWTILDIVITFATAATGKPIWLPLGYTIGASSILLVHLFKGAWKWTYVETLCLIGATVATYLWQTISGNAGVVAGVAAMYIAGLPMVFMMWRGADRKLYQLFAWCAVASFLTVLGTLPWTIGGSLLGTGGTVFNGLVAYRIKRHGV